MNTFQLILVAVFALSSVAVDSSRAEAAPLSVCELDSVVANVGSKALSKPRRSDEERQERREQRQERQNARMSALLPSQIDPRLAALDAVNPFDTEAYSVRVGETVNIASVDSFALATATFQGTVKIILYTAAQLEAGDLSVLTPAHIETIKQLALSLPGQASALPAQGQALLSSLPGELAGPAAMRLPAILRNVRASIANVTQTVALVDDAVRAAAALVVP